MYLRKVNRKNKNGTSTQYYQLAHNERDPKTKKPIAKIIHSFGRADRVDKNALARLCKSIARVCELKVLDKDEQMESEAFKDKLDTEMADSVKLIHTVEIGCVSVIEALWERLGIGEILRSIVGLKGSRIPYEKALLAMVANRLCEPGSKLGVWDRWLSKVYSSILLGVDTTANV